MVIDALYTDSFTNEDIVILDDIGTQLQPVYRGCRICGKPSDILNMPRDNDVYHLILTLSENQKRLQLVQEYEEMFAEANCKCEWLNISHNNACISPSVIMGQGNIFGPGTIVASNVIIGDFNIFGASVTVMDGVTIRDFNDFGALTLVCQGCCIGGANTFGVRSTITSKCTVENHQIIEDHVIRNE